MEGNLDPKTNRQTQLPAATGNAREYPTASGKRNPPPSVIVLRPVVCEENKQKPPNGCHCTVF